MLDTILNRVMSNVECCTTRNINIVVPSKWCFPENSRQYCWPRLHANLIALYAKYKYGYDTTISAQTAPIFLNAANADVSDLKPLPRVDIYIGTPWKEKHPNHIAVNGRESLELLWDEITDVVSVGIAPRLEDKKGLLIMSKSFIGARLITCVDDDDYFELISDDTEMVLKGWCLAMFGYDDFSQLNKS